MNIYCITDPTEDTKRFGWDGPGWYFFDDTEAYMHGPFASMDEAKEAERNYFDWPNSGVSPEKYRETMMERVSD